MADISKLKQVNYEFNDEQKKNIVKLREVIFEINNKRISKIIAGEKINRKRK